MKETVTLGTALSGAPDGGSLHLNLPNLIGSHAAIIANSGGGKSGLIRRLLETTHGEVLQIVLDAEDEFYTLRAKFPNFVIAGGDGADVPIATATAPALALATLEHSLSVIVQLNDLRERQAFIAAFLTALLDAPAKLWKPALVVIDEAQRFAPEEGGAQSTAAVLDLLARGRKRGFTAILAGNRMSLISKSALGNVNNWFLGRAGQDTDSKRAADSLGFRANSEEARGLRRLPPRNFWTFGPATVPIPVQFRVADVQTTIVRSGQSKVPTPPPAGKLKKVLEELAAAIPAPETSIPVAVADSRLVEELRGSLEMANEAVRLSEARADEFRGERDNALAELAETYERLKEVAGYMVEHGKTTRENGDGFEKFGGEILAGIKEPRPVAEKKPLFDGRPDDNPPNGLGSPGPDRGAEPFHLPPPVPRAAPTSKSEDSGIGGPGMKILSSLAMWLAMGHRQPSNAQVAWLAGYSPSSTSYTNPRSALRTRNLIEYPAPDRLELLSSGKTLVGSVPAPRGPLLAHVVGKLPGPEARILQTIAKHHPRACSNEAAARGAGYSPDSTSYTNPRSALKTKELISYPSPGQVQAAAWLFAR